MKIRMRNALRNVSAIVASIGRMLASLTEELAILTGLILIGIGFWDCWRPGSFLAPGIVLLWLFVPQREKFVRPTTVIQPRRRKES